MADPTCVFRCDAALIEALEASLGPPIDSYLSGWQVWFEPIPPDVEPGGGDEADAVELEWRLHPPGGFSQPEGLSHHDLWDEVVAQIAEGADVLDLGEEHRRLEEVWVLLEVYPAYGDLTPEELRESAETILGVSAVAAGRVDHGYLGGLWKSTKGEFDLPGALVQELEVARWW